jgi:flavin-dependent dehydrogenase
MMVDALIVGAGPAGASCAAFCAKAGLKVLVLERETFPREKVCGDCLNPLAWAVLERMGIADAVRGLPHSRLEKIEIATLARTLLDYPLPRDECGEIAIKRSLLDALLSQRAAQLGAEIRHGESIIRLEPIRHGWRVTTGCGIYTTKSLIAADGRNSTVARLLGILPSASRERVALQTHLPAPPGFGEKVLLRLLPEGYCGAASIGEGLINLCLVGRPGAISALKRRVQEMGMAPCGDQAFEWRTVAPLSRAPLLPAGMVKNVLLVGDASRVVEPFTGEGIYYALASGELAAACLAGRCGVREFVQAHRQLYAGRLWINQLAKLAVLHPRTASTLLGATRFTPSLLRRLTAQVVGN